MISRIKAKNYPLFMFYFHLILFHLASQHTISFLPPLFSVHLPLRALLITSYSLYNPDQRHETANCSAGYIICLKTCNRSNEFVCRCNEFEFNKPEKVSKILFRAPKLNFYISIGILFLFSSVFTQICVHSTCTETMYVFTYCSHFFSI